MNTRQYSMPADRQAINQRARETARRRGAYQAIDGAYSAGLITETARELAKWYVRHCCGMRSYHDLTQAAQAQQFGVSRRTIITLVQQLVAADLIWLELHGTRNRTFITAYQAPPTDDVDGTDAPSALASDVETPAYQQWRVAADAALAAGDTARAAMYEYQAAMELARLSNCTAVPVFGDWNGDPAITLNVQSGSPSPVNKDSGIPTGDTESSVCITDDDDGGSAPRPAYQATLTIPDTEATRLLQALGVRSPATLRKHASAPPELIRRAEQRRAALGYTTGLIGRILDDGGVIWGTCGQRVENQASALQDDRDAGHAKYIRGPLSKYIKTGLEDPLPATQSQRMIPNWRGIVAVACPGGVTVVHHEPPPVWARRLRRMPTRGAQQCLGMSHRGAGTACIAAHQRASAPHPQLAPARTGASTACPARCGGERMAVLRDDNLLVCG